MRRPLIIGINVPRIAAGVLARHSPQKEPRRRCLNRMQHIHDFVRIARAPERFFRLAKQRALVLTHSTRALFEQIETTLETTDSLQQGIARLNEGRRASLL
jgi:hypothetical protein